MLTARDGVEDRVAGLDAGADDLLAQADAGQHLVRTGRRVSSPTASSFGSALCRTRASRAIPTA